MLGIYFFQASVVHPLLMASVKSWAASSRGLFLVNPLASESEASRNGDSEFVAWTSAAADPELEARIKWPAFKKHERCLEKLLRVYQDDVSRLLDIVR